MMEKIGMCIRERRKELRMTQAMLAEQSNVNRTTISRLERGMVESCLVSTLTSIARVLGLNVNIFMS